MKEMRYLIVVTLVLLFLFSCGSKKVTTDYQHKEDTTVEVKDTTTTVSNIESEKQLITTDTKERIVTMYSVRFDTIYVEGERVITPIIFPTQTEEFRDITTSNYVWRLKMQDSIKNSLELKYANRLDEKEKTITKLTGTNKLMITASVVLLILITVTGIAMRYLKF